MKKTFKTKWLAMFLSLLMVTSLVPMSVYAEDNDDYSVRNIDITNVTFDYKAGMSPVATAKIANSDAHYEIEYERWSEIIQPFQLRIGYQILLKCNITMKMRSFITLKRIQNTPILCD